MNRKHSSLLLLTRTTLLAMPLALFACSEKSEQKAPAQGGSPTATAARAPEQLFQELGCGTCHGQGRPFADALAKARGKPPEVVAMWILDPQKVRPGVGMPSYVGRISTAEALALANWLKAGNPPASE